MFFVPITCSRNRSDERIIEFSICESSDDVQVLYLYSILTIIQYLLY